MTIGVFVRNSEQSVIHEHRVGNDHAHKCEQRRRHSLLDVHQGNNVHQTEIENQSTEERVTQGINVLQEQAVVTGQKDGANHVQCRRDQGQEHRRRVIYKSLTPHKRTSTRRTLLTNHLHSIDDRGRNHANSLSDQNEGTLMLVVAHQIRSHATKRCEDVIHNEQVHQGSVGVGGQLLLSTVHQRKGDAVLTTLLGAPLRDVIGQEHQHETNADGNSDNTTETVVIIIVIIVVESTESVEQEIDLVLLRSIRISLPGVRHHVQTARNSNIESHSKAQSEEANERPLLALLAHTHHLGDEVTEKLDSKQDARVNHNRLPVEFDFVE